MSDLINNDMIGQALRVRVDDETDPDREWNLVFDSRAEEYGLPGPAIVLDDVPRWPNTIPDMYSAGFNWYVTHNLLEQIHLSIPAKSNISALFYKAVNLISTPELDFSNAQYATNLFYGCTNLERVGFLDLSGVFSADRIFRGCSNLKVIEGIDLTSMSSLEPIFSDTPLLEEVHLYNLENISVTGNFLRNESNIHTLTLGGLSVDLDVSGTQLGTEGMDRLVESLASIEEGVSTLTYNSAIDFNKVAATNKGWTLVAREVV